MSCTNDIITLVRGNVIRVALPLEQILITEETRTVEDFVPLASDKITVSIRGRRAYSYTPTITDGNVAHFTIGPDVECGVYGIEVVVVRANGDQLRSFRLRQLSIVENNEQAGILPERVEFDLATITLDYAVFLFAKGDKGDKGDDGVSIVSVECVAPSTQSGGQNVILVTLSDGTTSQFIVRNGEKGDKGDAFTYADMTEQDKDDLVSHLDLSGYVNGGEYNSQAKEIWLKHNNTIVSRIDATEFIKDGMVENVEVIGSNVVITFNTDAGHETITIPISSIFDASLYYTKTEIDAMMPYIADIGLGELDDVEAVYNAYRNGKLCYLRDRFNYYLVVSATKTGTHYEIRAYRQTGDYTMERAYVSGYGESPRDADVVVTTLNYAKAAGDSQQNFAANELTVDTLNATSIYFAEENLYDLLDAKMDRAEMSQYARLNDDVAFKEISSTKLSGTDGAVEMVIPTFANADSNGIQISKGGQLRTTIPLNRESQIVAMVDDTPFIANVTVENETLVCDKSVLEIRNAWSDGRLCYMLYEGKQFNVYNCGVIMARPFFREYVNAVWSNGDEALRLNYTQRAGSSEIEIVPVTLGAFKVTISEDNGDYVADKTFAEIKAAYEAGQVVVAEYDGNLYQVTYYDYNDAENSGQIYFYNLDRLCEATFEFAYTDNDGLSISRDYVDLAQPVLRVGVTEDNQGNRSADISYADIAQAIDEGQTVVVDFGGCIYQLNYTNGGGTIYFSWTDAEENSISTLYINENEEVGVEWFIPQVELESGVNIRTVNGASLLDVDTSTDISTKFVVNISLLNNQYTADKTAAEIYTAFSAGSEVVAIYNKDIYTLSYTSNVGRILASFLHFDGSCADTFSFTTVGVTRYSYDVAQLNGDANVNFSADNLSASSITLNGTNLATTLSGKADLTNTSQTITSKDYVGTLKGGNGSFGVSSTNSGDTVQLYISGFRNNSWEFPIYKNGVVALTSDVANLCPVIEDTRESAVANITGNAPFASLVGGQVVIVKLAYATASSATLQLTLSGGTTTNAIPIYIASYRQTEVVMSTQYFRANDYMMMVYDATRNVWKCLSQLDTNTTYGMMVQSDISDSTNYARTTTGQLLRTNFYLKSEVNNLCPIIEDTRSSVVSAVTGVAPFSSLVGGQMVIIHFNKATTTSSTLTLTLSDGTTTAAIPMKASYHNAGNYDVNGDLKCNSGSYHLFVYDSTNNVWHTVGDIDYFVIYSTLTQATLDTGISTTGSSISAKLLRDNFYLKSEVNNICPIIEDTRSSEVAAITGVAPFASLTNGQQVLLHLAYATPSDSTLNLTLSDGTTTTGAKYIKYQCPRYSDQISNINSSYGKFVPSRYVSMIYNSTLDAWVCVATVDTNTMYGLMTQSEIDTGTSNMARTISPALLCDNFAKVVPIVTVTAASAITQACDPGKYYSIGECDSLDLSFTAGASGVLAIYAGKFTTSSSWSALTIPSTVDEAAGNDTVAASKTYEFNMMDNIIIIKEV